MPFWFLLLSVSMVHLRPGVSGCGVSTHISIAHEASFYMKESKYADIAKSNRDAFVAGNPYPDFAYASQCFDGKYHDVSETTHWAPFLNATVNYIRRNFKQPWNAVADISWHSLGIDQGFIRAMANVNFHAVFEDAHGTADVGGDMISQLEGDDSLINQLQWFIPSKDLYQIYLDYYGKEMVTQEIIEECTTLLFLAWLGEKIAGAKLFKKYAKESPFLHEKLHNYFLGGIHDMAAWTNEIWSHTETMMEHGTEACHIPRNTLFITCSGNEMTGKSSGKLLKNPGKSYLRVKHDLKVHDVIKMKKNNGMVLYPKVKILNMIKERKDNWLDETRLLHRKPEIPNANLKDSLQPYAEGGMSLLYSDDLPMGATLLYGAPNNNQKGSPQLGRVYLVNLTSGWSSQNNFHSSKLPLRSHLNDFSYDVIDGSERMSKFGWSMAIVDVNKDGLADLAVGAPSQGSSQLKYYGAVHIYFGRKGQNYSKSPDLTFHGNTTFENLGFALQGTDINGDGFKDLIIGSPFAPAGGVQRGRVDVVYANSKKSDIKRTLFAAGTQDYEWLGYSLLFKREQGKPLLLLGAPAYRKCFKQDCSYSPHDVQQLGRVFIYDLSFARPKLAAVLEGLKRFSKFGASLAAGLPFGTSSGTMLAVGAPSVDVKGHLVDMVPNTFTQAGTVHLFNLTLLVRSGFHFNENLFSSSAVVGNFSGDRDYGGFGMAIKFEDTNGDSVDDIIIGAPFRTEDLTEEIIGAESGAVYIFNGGKSFPTGDATGDCASTTVQPCPQLKASRTFNGKEYNARFGSAFAVGKLPLMFISSPRSSLYSFHTGLVEIVKL